MVEKIKKVVAWVNRWIVPCLKFYWKSNSHVKGLIIGCISLVVWWVYRPLHSTIQPSDLIVFFWFFGLGVLLITAYYQQHEKHMKFYARFAHFVQHGFQFLGAFYLFTGGVVAFIRGESIFLLLVGGVFEVLGFIAVYFLPSQKEMVCSKKSAVNAVITSNEDTLLHCGNASENKNKIK